MRVCYFDIFINKQMIGNFSLAAILPKKTQQGYVVCLVRLLDFNPENFLFPRTIRLLDMIIALYYYTQGPSNGLVAVFDAQGFTLGHLTRFNLTILKHALDYLQVSHDFK